MSGHGADTSVPEDEVKAKSKVKRNRKPKKTKVGDDDDNDALSIITENIKIEDTDADTLDDVTTHHNGNEDEEPIGENQQEDDPAPPPAEGVPRSEVDLDVDDEETQDADVFDVHKDSDVEPLDEAPFKIDKVYSVAKDKNKPSSTTNPAEDSVRSSSSTSSTKKELKLEGRSKSETSKKPLKPKLAPTPTPTLTTLAKMPTLTGGVGGMRLLAGGGVRGANVPLLVSMGAGNPGIPLLPAGLPPGRYVILPGTSSTTKTTCATVNTTSASLAPRLATSLHAPVVTATTPAVVGQAAAAAVSAVAPAVVTSVTTTTTTTTSSSSSTSSSSTTPSSTVVATVRSIQIPTVTSAAVAAQAAKSSNSNSSSYSTRERGRRKSYTTGEKLAMIEAVEAGQRKSTVADRFGVAPSTLACILAQKNKIRAERDNLMRRRFRHVKYEESGRGGVVGASSSRGAPAGAAPTLSLTQSQEQPFTHFLASLTGPTPTVLDTQPEEIIAVPDLIESGTGSGGSAAEEAEAAGTEAKGGADEEGDEEEGGGGGGSVECLGVAEGGGAPSSDAEYQQEQGRVAPSLHKKASSSGASSSLYKNQNESADDAYKQETSDRASPPSSQGLTGPYLLKKETHCTTVLDQLLRDDTFTDVTLTAEGQSLRAHRIVLCLASPYFRQVLSREQNIQSVVLLRDVKFAELRNIIHFIYTGEATVDAADLESFLRTAEMLEITSLSEGQKYISSRGLSQGNAASGFSIGDFERLVGAKRSSKEPSSPPRKSRKISGENSTVRSPADEPCVSSAPMVLVKEEQDVDHPLPLQEEKPLKEKSTPLKASESTVLETPRSEKEVAVNKRKRRASSESIGGFAAIAGVQKTPSEADEEEVFTEAVKLETPQLPEPDKPLSTENTETSSAIPGRCPYCPHIDQKFEGVTMMRHLLVSHPCKPAFPCSFCWRVFVKRSHFKNHLENCPLSY